MMLGSRTLNRAFHAALMLTGSARLAENAVLDGIDALAPDEDLDEKLVRQTIDSAIRRRVDSPNPFEPPLSLLPVELQRLMLLAPVSRDCFVLRTLVGMNPTSCAAALNLRIEEFEEALAAAFRKLPTLEVCATTGR